MLWTKIFILAGAWTVGFNFEGQAVGNLIQILLVGSLVLLIGQYIRERRVKAQVESKQKAGRVPLRNENSSVDAAAAGPRTLLSTVPQSPHSPV